jgi:hypothetical protein
MVVVPARRATQVGGIDSLKSIPGLFISLKIQPLAGRYDNPIPPRFLAPIDCSKIPTQLASKDEYLAASQRVKMTGEGGEGPK